MALISLANPASTTNLLGHLLKINKLMKGGRNILKERTYTKPLEASSLCAAGISGRRLKRDVKKR